MSIYSLESETASIVLVGPFNPAMFHPEWLLRNGLISEDDSKGAKIEVIHNQLSKFDLEWLHIDVLNEKFIARTNAASFFPVLRDLMCSLLRILEHVPIKQVGMNINLSYRINDEKIWHKIGDNLVPKKYWDTLKGRVGMRAVYVEGQRDDNLKGYVRIGLLPTKNEEYVGVNFDVNNHVDLEDCNAKDILFENWDKIIDFSKNVCKETLMKAMEQ